MLLCFFESMFLTVFFSSEKDPTASWEVISMSPFLSVACKRFNMLRVIVACASMFHC